MDKDIINAIGSGAVFLVGAVRLFVLIREIKKGSIRDRTTVNRDDDRAGFIKKAIFVSLVSTGLTVIGLLLFVPALFRVLKGL